MGSASSEKAHAVCVPFPAQGHMNPMLKVAKLLHSHGFHITFVLTEFNHRRLVLSSGQEAVRGLPDFHFRTIPDGLPFSEEDATQDIPTLCESTSMNCLPHFRRLLAELNEEKNNNSRPPVSCIVSDGVMSFTLDAARELGIPDVLFWTTSACGYLAYNYYRHLIDRGLIPLKDIGNVNDGFLDAKVDWIPGLMKDMRLKDFPTFIRTVDANDIMLNFLVQETWRSSQASAIILNTFVDLEQLAITTLEKLLPPIYSIGPLTLLSGNKIFNESPTTTITSSLWKKDDFCLNWLDGHHDPRSIVYVNFGSITMITNEQLLEFAWGLANSRYHFLWVIRPDIVKGESSVLPPEFIEETKERGLMVSWCAQEEVLMHPTVGVFLTHSGWNSTIESISFGVPMLCWPFFAEQQTNCKYACMEWGVGLEIDNNVKRKEVEELIREMMAGEKKGKEIQKKAMEWKESAVKATGPDGASLVNFERMINEVLLRNKENQPKNNGVK
ncbi:7-deoxyloganetin glucosyltransferase-like [Dendrobium catenatum]|uniref:Glycosyltransferase n=1 Tax=Dendrobium catenatum TaxID=906689 RepID=A0A2I0W5E9_9ASPA|nr:7-deoxyloganetin glucosyltransferase-like [Dendrobium catenatum]PKU70888.1 UDP-glycosyltransferase 85A2 [Dendrobium catenatum]